MLTDLLDTWLPQTFNLYLAFNTVSAKRNKVQCSEARYASICPQKPVIPLGLGPHPRYNYTRGLTQDLKPNKLQVRAG